MLNSGKTKPFKTYDEQVDLLIKRGLLVSDRKKAVSVLKRINYYRFSAYSLTLRKNDVFYPNVTFENICELYQFDDAFRQIILKYSLVVETAFRSYIAHVHSRKYTPVGYLDPSNFEDIARHSRFIVELDHEIDRSDDLFVTHHKNDLNSVFPIWVAIEVTTFGALSKLFKNMKQADRTEISRDFVGFGRMYVENWLQCCSYCRNIAAHGGRFYNRLLMANPVRLNPKKHAGINNVSPFAFVIAIYNLLPSRDLKDSLKKDLNDAFSRYPFALKKHLGFPENWKSVLI